jgi:hypothetical protein
MATSDGIPSEDWDVIHEHALDCANATLRSDMRAHAEAQQRMLESLESLEARFGRLPSILATRADHVDDRPVKEALFREAYTAADRLGDKHNQLLIAHSLAKLYVDDHRDVPKGRVWLTKLRDHMAELDEPDAQFNKDYRRLTRVLMTLDW